VALEKVLDSCFLPISDLSKSLTDEPDTGINDMHTLPWRMCGEGGISERVSLGNCSYSVCLLSSIRGDAVFHLDVFCIIVFLSD
jgi:hypothetical protein